MWFLDFRQNPVLSGTGARIDDANIVRCAINSHYSPPCRTWYNTIYIISLCWKYPFFINITWPIICLNSTYWCCCIISTKNTIIITLGWKSISSISLPCYIPFLVCIITIIIIKLNIITSSILRNNKTFIWLWLWWKAINTIINDTYSLIIYQISLCWFINISRWRRPLSNKFLPFCDGTNTNIIVILLILE